MTADTFSNALGFLIMGVGNDNNSWGGNCSNSVFQIFEDSIAGQSANSVTGGTLDLSGSPPPAAASQARYGIFNFTGVLTSNQTVIVPNLSKQWLVFNNTTGNFALLWQTTAGTAVQIPQGTWKVLWCDGANGMYRLDGKEVGQFADFGTPLVPSGYLERNGAALSRANYPDLFTALTIQGNGTRASTGNGIISGLTSTTNMKVGYYVSGTGIFSGGTIASVDSSTQITVSGNNTSTGTTNVVVSPWPLGDGSTTFNLPTSNDTGRFTRARTSTVAIGVSQSNGITSHTHSVTSNVTVASVSTPVTTSFVNNGSDSHNHALDYSTAAIGQGPGASVVAITSLNTPGSGPLAQISRANVTGATITSTTTAPTVTLTNNAVASGPNSGAISETRPEAIVALGCIKY